MTAIVDPGTFAGSVYSGEWIAPRGGSAPILEPATGKELGTTGIADAADIADAAAAAAVAQRDWAAATFADRAAVLRRAGALIEENAAELRGWVTRETGAVAGLAGFAVGVAAQECYEAAALASRPPGELLPTTEPRPVAAAPGAGRRGRRDLPVQRAADPLDPLGRPRARAGQRGRAQARPRARRSAAGSPSPRVLAEAGLPEGVLHVLPGGAEAGAALVADPHVRLISFTGSDHDRPRGGGARGAPPQAGAPGAGRELGARRARRRRRRPRGLGRRLGLLPAPGPDLHDHRPAPGARARRRRLRRGARRARERAAGRRPHRRGGARPADRRGPAGQGARRW